MRIYFVSTEILDFIAMYMEHLGNSLVFSLYMKIFKNEGKLLDN